MKHGIVDVHFYTSPCILYTDNHVSNEDLLRSCNSSYLGRLIEPPFVLRTLILAR